MVECAPPPDHASGAVELDHLVAHDLLPLAGRVGVGFAGVVVVDFAQFAANHEEVPVGKFLEAVVHGEGIYGSARAGALRPPRRAPVSFDVPQKVDLHQAIVVGDERDVAVAQAVNVGGAIRAAVVPHDAAAFVEREDEPVAGGEDRLAGSGAAAPPSPALAPNAEQRPPRFHPLGRGGEHLDGRKLRLVGRKRGSVKLERPPGARGYARAVADLDANLVPLAGVEAHQRQARRCVRGGRKLHLPPPVSVRDRDGSRDRRAGNESEQRRQGNRGIRIRNHRWLRGELGGAKRAGAHEEKRAAKHRILARVYYA